MFHLDITLFKLIGEIFEVHSMHPLCYELTYHMTVTRGGRFVSKECYLLLKKAAVQFLSKSKLIQENVYTEIQKQFQG